MFVYKERDIRMFITTLFIMVKKIGSSLNVH